MNGSSTLNNNLTPVRLITFGVFVVIVFIIYIYRLFSLQIIEGPFWMSKAEDNRTTIVNDPTLRGIIFDRNGTVLARNIASYNVVIIPTNLPDDPGEEQRIYRELAPLIDMPVNLSSLEETPYVPCLSALGIAQIVEYGLTTAPYSPVKVRCDVDQDVALRVKEKAVDWPGVEIQIEPIRDYPTGYLTSTFIGYLGPISALVQEKFEALGFDTNRDKIGYAGVEATFQEILAGQNGARLVERDVAGQILRTIEEIRPVQPGLNVRLTIDTRLQAAVDAIVTSELNGWNAYLGDIRMTSGVAIVINPQTGEILAMVSFPSYENNRLARFIPSYYYQQLASDVRKPLLNHAVGDILPVGSIFKLVTATGALNEGVVTPDQIIKTPGILNITERFSVNDPGQSKEFYDHNWKSGGFGQLDFVHGLANSSNVYFYKLGGGYMDEVQPGLGICRLGSYAKALGYGDYPGTGLPDEEKGLIPDPEYKRRIGESWTLGDTYLVSVGQGYVLTTPLQALLSAATIAADGKLFEPTIIYEVLDGEGNVVQPFEPKLRWDITVDPVIKEYEAEYGIRGCSDAETGNMKTVEPWVVDKVQEGMRLAVTEGTLSDEFLGYQNLNIAVAGKTGTAEYCDEYAIAARGGRMCDRGDWPTHAWTLAYAPYDNPEIAVVGFVYNGGEGSSVAGPIVKRVIDAYFRLKAVDNALAAP